MNTYLNDKTYLKYGFTVNMEKEETCAYIALKSMYDKMLTKNRDEVEIYFTLEQLFWELSGGFKPNRHDKKKLKQGVEELIEHKIIKLIGNDKDTYVVDASGLYIRNKKNGDEVNDKYVGATRKEIRTIFNLKFKQNYSLLRFAMLLFSTVNNGENNDEYKCGFMARETAIKEFSLSGNRAYQDYFKLLEDNNIIYVHHSNTTKIQEDGSVKTLSNIYGRPCDKEYVDNYAGIQQEKESHDFRSLPDKSDVTRKYDKYTKNPDSFSEAEVAELYDACKRYNDMPLQRQGKVEKYELSVFKGVGNTKPKKRKLFGAKAETKHTVHKAVAVEYDSKYDNYTVDMAQSQTTYNDDDELDW